MCYVVVVVVISSTLCGFHMRQRLLCIGHTVHIHSTMVINYNIQVKCSPWLFVFVIRCIASCEGSLVYGYFIVLNNSVGGKRVAAPQLRD